jgi:hypothetical protein
MLNSFPEELLNNFTYSKKSHFDFFIKCGYDIEVYGKTLNIEEDVDLISYQNLLLYSLLKGKSNLKILQIGTKNLVAFEKLQNIHECWKIDIDNLSKSETDFQFVSISKNEFPKIKNPKSYFDFIFFPDTNSVIPKDHELLDKILLNLKLVLKLKGILLSSFTNVVRNDNIWFDDFYKLFRTDDNRLNHIESYNSIIKDPDLFVLPEFYYNKYWKQHTNKSYQEFGKAFSYNLFLENRDKIHTWNISDFTYLKKSHAEFFNSNGYKEELFGNDIDIKLGAENYACLVIYSFIKSNFKKGDKILQIGGASDYLEKALSKDYELYKLEDLKIFQDNTNGDDKIINSKENRDVGKNDFKNTFHFIYSVNGYEKIDLNLIEHYRIINNINRILQYGGFVLFSFKLHLISNNLKFSNLVFTLVKNNVFKFNGFISKDLLLSDENFFYTEINNSYKPGSDNEANVIIKESFYNLLWMKVNLLPAVCSTRHDNRLKKYPVFIFHHLIKCGGTSLFFILDKWFKKIDDNILEEDLNSYVVKKYDTNLFHNDVCLRAHFQRAGIYLHERYPELLGRPDEFKAFTFIRNPLSLKISKFYFLRSLKAINENSKLEDSLMSGKNFIASQFPCDETNYKEILDRYYFIGIVERLQESFDLLADMIGKTRQEIPRLNTSEKDDQMKFITPEFIAEFKRKNELDYKIYDYCLEKFNRLIAKK